MELAQLIGGALCIAPASIVGLAVPRTGELIPLSLACSFLESLDAKSLYEVLTSAQASNPHSAPNHTPPQHTTHTLARTAYLNPHTSHPITTHTT